MAAQSRSHFNEYPGLSLRLVDRQIQEVRLRQHDAQPSQVTSAAAVAHESARESGEILPLRSGALPEVIALDHFHQPGRGREGLNQDTVKRQVVIGVRGMKLSHSLPAFKSCLSPVAQSQQLERELLEVEALGQQPERGRDKRPMRLDELRDQPVSCRVIPDPRYPHELGQAASRVDIAKRGATLAFEIGRADHVVLAPDGPMALPRGPEEVHVGWQRVVHPGVEGASIKATIVVDHQVDVGEARRLPQPIYVPRAVAENRARTVGVEIVNERRNLVPVGRSFARRRCGEDLTKPPSV